MASGEWKKKAIAFIRKFNADLGTATGLALKDAFKDKSADTIVLLSDGAPHNQRGTPDELIPIVQELVKDLNRLRKVKIFTFGFEGLGQWPPGSKYEGRSVVYDAEQLVRFLKNLAENNGGRYTPID